MVRVLAPGGRLSLIDTDWRTFALDLPADAGTELTGAMLRMFGESSMAGGRLLNLCREAGLEQLRCTGATHVATRWDPDGAPGADGLPPVFELVPHLVARGALDAAAADRAVAALVAAAEADRFFASLSMVAVVGVKPAQP
jgi:hypothetical protein